MSFTFGGFNPKFVRGEQITKISLQAPQGNIIEMKETLSSQSPLFTLDPILVIIRDYILGAPFLHTDLFPKTHISLHEVYVLLSSVACCHECTKYVFSTLLECTMEKVEVVEFKSLPKPFPSGDTLSLTGKKFTMEHMCKYYITMLTCRYVLMKNLASLNYMLEIMDPRDIAFTISVKDSILPYGYWESKEPFNIYSIAIMRAIPPSIEDMLTFSVSMVKTCGVGILKGRRRHQGEIGAVLSAVLISCVSYLQGEDVKRGLYHLRRAIDRNTYYRQLGITIAYPRFHVIRTDLNLHLADMIFMSMNIFRDICTGTFTANPIYINFLWKLPSSLLEKHCKVIGRLENDENEAPYMTVVHDHATYHIRLGVIPIEDGSLWPAYSYSEKEVIGYAALLYIIAHRFLWTYDREYILTVLRDIQLDSHIEEIDKATYEHPIQHLLVPVGGYAKHR